MELVTTRKQAIKTLITSADLKEIYFCIGFLKADRTYQGLDMNDFAR